MRPYFSANLVLTWNYKVNTNHIDWSEHLNNNRDIEKKRTRKSSDSQKIEYCNTANTYEAKNRKSCNTNTRPEERKRMRGFSVAELTEKQKQSRETDEKSKHTKSKKNHQLTRLFLDAVTKQRTTVSMDTFLLKK